MYCFSKPVAYLFDFEKANVSGEYLLRYKQPYSDIESLDETERQRFLRPEEPLEFGHSLDHQLGVMLKAGFKLTDLYEDSWGDEKNKPSR